MQEKEVSFPIEQFSGINRNIDREKMSPLNLWTAQNLWEKSLNVIETRGNSVSFAEFPTNVTKLLGVHKLYKDSGDHCRVVGVKCTTDTDDAFALPTGFAVTLVADTTGWWTKTQTFSGIDYSGTPSFIRIRFIGYGVEKWSDAITYTGISGYSAATRQKLRITLTAAQNSNITGYEVYAAIDMGISGNARNMYIWAGFNSLVGVTTATHDFLYCPLGQVTATASLEIGEVKRVPTLTASETGGTLIGGKTYYVAFAALNQVFSVTTGTRRVAYALRNITRGTDASVIPVTIPGTGTTGSITVLPDIATVSGVVCIGEDPELLQPVSVWNDPTDGLSLSTATPIITDYPVGSPAVFDISYEQITAAQEDYVFAISMYSLVDMFIKVADDETFTPVFHGRMTQASTFVDNVGARIGDITGSFYTPAMGSGNSIQFEQFNELLFHVNGRDVTQGADDTQTLQSHLTDSNYSMCDGNISAPVIQYVNAAPAILPCFKYIAKYQGSIVLGGGPKTVSRLDGSTLSAARANYFSNALNPYDFAISGGTLIQTIAVQDDEEEISGIGIYSNSSGQDGPISQLLTTKKNKLYVLTNLPSVVTGELDPSVRQITLSSKVGNVSGNTIVNTPIGTIIVSADDVYVVRGDGEPTPIGREISAILKGADLTNAVAVYHDRHLKISFYHEDYDTDELGSDINNVEFWLDINKLIEQKGVPSWVGPMIGHWNQHCFVEDRSGDGLSNNVARDRFCCNGSVVTATEPAMLYKADVYPDDSDTYCTDFNAKIESIFDTKDMEITQQDNNWNKLVKRTYWKLRVANESVSPADIEESTYIDGELFETKEFEAYGLDDTDFYDQPLKLARLFPTGRPRGRTIRKTLTTSDRIAIAGFQLNYSPERRRI